MKINKLDVPDVYKSIYQTDKPIILVTGGRGSAKSFNVSLFLKRLSYEANQVILFSRYTMTSASDSIIPEISEKIEMEGDDDYFHVTKNAVINKVSGSPILFRGIKISSGNQTAKLKGIQGLSTFVADEAEEWQSEEDFDTLSLSIRSKKAKNRVIIVMNPSNYNHFIFKKFIKDSHKTIEVDGAKIQISTHPQVHHIHTTYINNLEHLSAKFLNEVEEIKRTNQDKYKHKILGAWKTQSDNLCITNWEEYADDSDCEHLPKMFGIDWGFVDPFTLIQVHFDWKKKHLYVKELVYLSGLEPNQCLDQANKVVTEADKSRITICDSANPSNKLMFLNSGWNIYGSKKEKVFEGVQNLQNWKIFIHVDSHNAKEELNNYSFSQKDPEQPIDDFNHIIDPLRYVEREIRYEIIG